MLKPGALLLLLAVAASQVRLSESSGFKSLPYTLDVSKCPIAFYGKTANFIKMTNNMNGIQVCFIEYTPAAAVDCIEVANGDGTKFVSWSLKTGPTVVGSPVHNALPSIKSNSSCYVDLHFKQGTPGTIRWSLYNFNQETALKIIKTDSYSSALNLTVKVNNTAMETLSFPLENVTAGIYLKFFHCRVKGVIYQPNTVLDTDPAACRHQICDAASVVQTTTCGYSELCEGNFTCVPRPPVVCTVVGSTVIDFFNRTHSIPDRCKYNLFGLNASLTESVIVGFREQRRRDVPLLDHVTINYNREKFTLEQGGRVLGRKNTLMLNATAQLFNGVELSKDHAGVAVKWLSHNVEIFFDGSMVHIAAPFDLAAVGLCGNPTDNTETTRPAVSKNIAASAADCATPHKDAIDSTINCNRSTELCNHMMHAPFTPCHAEIDPQRYISACIDTLCRYPAVDGHKCHFMEAYAKSCSLKNIDLGSWRSMASCPAVPQTFHCLRHYCSDHEFCGIQYGQTHCLCRADFAAKYKPKNTLGDPTVCSQNSATLTLAGCLLEDKGIDYTVLHLNDPSCRGNMDPKSHMVTFEYDAMNTCGTEVTMNNHSQVIYTNTIKMRNGSNDIIVRHDQVEIDFSCMYRKPDIESVSFRIADSSVVQKIKSSIWNYTLTMSAYSNAGLTNLISPNTDIQLNQKVWLELKTTGLDDSMVSIVTDSCWATNQPSAVGGLHYDLVKNGCPDDPTVEVERSGRDTTNIVAFNMFQFSGQTGQIYLHCKLELCIKSTNTCAPVCGGSRRRRRSSRSSYVDENPALITMSWSN